LMVEL